MTPTRWLILIISLVIGGIPDVVFFDAIEALAQKRPNDAAFLGFLLVLVFVVAAGSVFAILDAVFVKGKRIRW
jgi:SpoVK/Ycf46/Vps4 family AAA+-type ATPase